jgi:hypothetical protein
VAIPRIDTLKPLCLETELVRQGQPRAAIVSPASGVYRASAERIAGAIEQLTGTRLPIVDDQAPQAALPFTQNVILLGNRSTNPAIARLYDRYFTLVDLRWPGPGGYDLRTLHNPFGNCANAVIVGASDAAGLTRGVERFVAKLRSAAAGKTLRLGRLADVVPGVGVTITRDPEQVETWEASAGYRSIGYFGWNSLSKRMALYYLTGDKAYARDFLRLAFPDAQAKAQIARIDGERIENKDQPLGGPYHYCAHMMILYWDLIEESPDFTAAERLAVTRALAEQLQHFAAEGQHAGRWSPNPRVVGSRHGQWAAISVYCLARYFQTHYPAPIWKANLEAAQRQFRSLHEHAWVAGENDNLFWYNTAIAPVLTYLVLTGDRVAVENGVLATLLRGQEALVSGRKPDWALTSAALGFLHTAAYLTGDGRWLTYRDRTGLDTTVFRVGQSFWPDDRLHPTRPDDLAGRWTIHRLPQPMWKARASGLPHDESFQFGSFRSRPDAEGDFILLDGFNGASRNPYHTFAILNLRIDGYPLLNDYLNQVITRSDGLMEPRIAMDAALKRSGVIGRSAFAVAEVPRAAYANWSRALVQRVGRYALLVDRLTYREASPSAEILFQWQTEVGARSPTPGVLLFAPVRTFGAKRAEPGGHIVMCDPLRVAGGGNQCTMQWMGPVSAGQERVFFSLVAMKPGSKGQTLDCRRIDAHRAALSLPGPALAWAEGESLGVLAEDHLLALQVTRVPLLNCSRAVDVDWDFTARRLVVSTAGDVRLSLQVDPASQPTVDERRVPVSADGRIVLDLQAGRHEIQGVRPPASEVDRGLADARRVLTGPRPTANTRIVDPPVTEWKPRTSLQLDGPVTDLAVLPGAKGPMIAAAAGKNVHRIGCDGTLLDQLPADGPIRMLRCWPETGLLLAGCADEKVIAFDQTGARRWVFVSEMDPAVFRAAKTYWFKSEPGHEGIHGLHTGAWLPGGTQAFVGSACTLEVLDAQGKLIRRMPQFWGKNSTFALLDGPHGTRNLLVSRKYNGTDDVSILNSAAPDPTARGFTALPAGQTYMPGWSSMNRLHIFSTDLEGTGTCDVVMEINGSWNRVCVWGADGKPKYAANFGPGPRIPAVTMRDLEVGDLDGDGRQEIVAATAQGLVVALSSRCEKRWTARLPSPATVMAFIGSRIVLGCDDSRLRVLDRDGRLLHTGPLGSAPTCIRSTVDASGKLAVFGTAAGRVVIYAIREE